MKKKNASGNKRQVVRKANVKVKKPRQFGMRETIDKIHHTVIRIENEHGSAIKAIGEGLALTTSDSIGSRKTSTSDSTLWTNV